MRGIKLKKFSEKLAKNVIEYDKPDYVYIPLLCANNTDCKALVEKGDSVLIGSRIGISKKFDLPILSSVSGKVVGIEDMYTYTGEVVPTIKIKNDFKDKYVDVDEVKPISEYTKKEFIKILKDFGIRGAGGADFPTYIKYDNKNIKNLIINAVECEPYIMADYALIKDNVEILLETIDAILTINKIDNAYFAIKRNKKELISKIKEYIGTYPNIHLVLVPDIYPAGWERNLVKYVLNKEYDKLPSEVETVVSNITTIYEIYNALKFKKYMCSRIVTFAGDGLKRNSNVLIRVGSLIEEVLDKLNHKKRDLILISGGPMLGHAIKNENFVITINVNAVLLIRELKEEVLTTCIRCGKCSSVCPAKLSPVMIKENINNIEELKKLHVLDCVECGLCSYICPAKIMLREHVRLAKKKVRD